jgi:DNA-binding CsgD family transcriptional regulator
METLSIDDIARLNQGIQEIYALHDLDTFAVKALTIVDRIVPSDLPNFHLTNVRSRQISSIFLPSFPGYATEMQVDRVIHQYFDEHPIAARLPQTLDGAYKISDFVTQPQLHLLEGIYQRYLRPLDLQDQLTFFLPPDRFGRVNSLARSNTNLIGFSFNRNQCNFTERDRLILNLLRLHLSQAYTNAEKFHQLQQEINQNQQWLNRLGAVILDCELRLESIAPQAIIWLEAYFGKYTELRQLPDRLRSWVRYKITNLTHNLDLPDSCLPLHIQQNGRELTIRLVVVPEASQYLLLLEEKPLLSVNSLAILGLSKRETEVLGLIIQGKENKEIAIHLNIKLSTVCKHVASIYTNFAVKSRTETISYAFAKLGLF